MSHFCVMVIGEDHEKQLAPFDENLEMPRHIKATKKQLIERERQSIEKYKNSVYAEYLKDKEAYKSKCLNQKHIDYLESEFPSKLNYTEEQLYAEATRYYEEDEIGPEGEVYSTYNPQAKWDWYTIGGRYCGSIILKDGCERMCGIGFPFDLEPKHKRQLISENRADMAYKKDIKNWDELTCFALVKDGKWYEKGDMCWWGIVANEKEDEIWEEGFKKLISNLPDDTLITIVDCHI